MKRLFIFLFLQTLGVYSFSQNTLYNILKTRDYKEFTQYSKDIYNPINFTYISERLPKRDGKNSRYNFRLYSGMDYIQKGSKIHIEFNKLFVDELDTNFQSSVLAYIQRKDKTIKPLNIFGYTKVESTSTNTEKMKEGVQSDGGIASINYTYKVSRLSEHGNSYSGELNLSWEDIDVNDKIILHVTNTKMNNTGFSLTLEYDDFGWQKNPTGGFSFVKILDSEFTEFSPAASIGYSFHYKPRKSSSFWRHFLSPSFGPILNVFQNSDNTTIGAGLYLSTFYNMVSLGGGYTINGINHGKPYLSIGFNFIEGYNTLTSLVKKEG